MRKVQIIILLIAGLSIFLAFIFNIEHHSDNNVVPTVSSIKAPGYIGRMQ